LALTQNLQPRSKLMVQSARLNQQRAATFKLPSLVGQASPLVIIMSGEDA